MSNAGADGLYRHPPSSKVSKIILHDAHLHQRPIHLGTAMNKCSGFHRQVETMSGFDAPTFAGTATACHRNKSRQGTRAKARDASDGARRVPQYAQNSSPAAPEFKRIVSSVVRQTYATMTPQYESWCSPLSFFYENGFVYKGLRAVYWCMHDETALAEAEVEYENHTSSTSGKVRPARRSGKARRRSGKKLNTIIWTTTPWTLPASMALHFIPTKNMCSGIGSEVYIVASKLAKDAAEKCGSRSRELATFPDASSSAQLPASSLIANARLLADTSL